ncbi:MAG: tetratricopeptide repeat protein [Myxococcota bacterium]|nr:tetratricopeptide repeat protein [Myxococcota bacterium]
MILLALACVLDRTGQSATAAYERELALQATHTEALESEAQTLQRRVDQLEEINRYRGQQEAEKLENLDQVQTELQKLRGAIEEAEFAAEQAAEQRSALDEDVAFRLEYLELRVAELERQLGLEPPQPPGETGLEVGEDGEVLNSDGTPSEVELPTEPAELLAKAEDALAANKPAVARALLERLLREAPKDPLAAKARYRLAESWYNEKQYQRAILAFEDVVSKHPDSDWAPWAMVRQGECFQELGQRAEAELFWQDVVDRYPGTQAAKDAKALLKG